LYFNNERQAFEEFLEWVNHAKQKMGASNIIVAMEPTGHYYFALEEYLEDLGIEVVIVNARDVNQMGKYYHNQHSKSDPRDAVLIGYLCSEGRYSVTTRPKEGPYAELRELTVRREQLVKKQMASINELHSLFTQIFPEYKQLKTSGLSEGLLAIFLELQTLEAIQAAGWEGLYDILKKHRKYQIGKDKAKQIHALSTTSIGIKRKVKATQTVLISMIEEYQFYQQQIKAIDEQIIAQLNEMDAAKRLMAIPGIGPIITATFLAEVGDIANYKSAKQIQKLAGYAICTNESGHHKGKTRTSKMGRKRLKKILYQAALATISNNDDINEIYTYYTQERKEPLKKMKAVTAISCKLIRIFFSLLKYNHHYDGKKMLSDIKRPQGQAA
jgi:transposase